MNFSPGVDPSSKTGCPLVDFVIVGAGISGIGFAYQILNKCPGQSIKIIEARSSLGGTWDLFRYPGIRSDSDMYTFSYGFNPWGRSTIFQDGPSILEYLRKTSRMFNIDKYIEYNKRVQAASWSSTAQRWMLTINSADSGDSTITHCSCRFLIICTGYYNYSSGYVPTFPGQENFPGLLIHPQAWPTDSKDTSLYANKKVIIIGSGATAVTLVPEMAKHAAQVTMVQRSPTYIASLPSKSSLFSFLSACWIPLKYCSVITRWASLIIGVVEYYFCIKFPKLSKFLVLADLKRQLRTCSSVSVDRDFNPSYDPWTQRFCACPDGDFMAALCNGSATVVTSEIAKLGSKGSPGSQQGVVTLKNGDELAADIVVVATGLKVLLHGGMEISVDGEPINQSNMLCYKGLMLNGVPNFFFVMGYLNASWTIRSDMVAKYTTRLIDHMQRKGLSVCRPVFDATKDPSTKLESFSAAFSSGYFKRAECGDELYRVSASRYPWQANKWVLADLAMLAFSSVKDNEMHFA